MRDTARKFSKRLHTLSLTPFILKQPPLGYVLGHHLVTCRTSLFVSNSSSARSQQDRAAVLPFTNHLYVPLVIKLCVQINHSLAICRTCIEVLHEVERQEFFFRIVAQYAYDRRIGDEESALRRRAKDS